MNHRALLNTITTRNFTLPIVILYVTAGCNLRCIMCSYRDPLPGELSLDDIKRLSGDLSNLGLRHIVYSGGEPLTRRDFPAICKIFNVIGVRQSLLTNGLLLKKRYPEIKPYVSEIIISLDGPDAKTHNDIRGVEAFDQVINGIESVTSSEPKPTVSIRVVIQRKNFRQMKEMVELAKSLRVNRISFLAADISSDAFYRDKSGNVSDKNEIALTRKETVEFRNVIAEFVNEFRYDIEHRFISENPDKLFHIVRYFEALTETAPFPRNNCNAPMISTVITSTGDLLPCYFLPAFGNVKTGVLRQLLNSSEIRDTRRRVKEYTLKRCHECVCTLKVHPIKAFADKF